MIVINNGMNPEQDWLSLESGKNVIVEKPCSYNSDIHIIPLILSLPKSIYYFISRIAFLTGRIHFGDTDNSSKPLAASEIESEELAKLAKERQLFLYEAITTRYLGQFYIRS